MTAGRIVFDGVSKLFPGSSATPALDDVSLEVQPGRVTGVIGYSGAGKSTLIRTVNGLEQPTSGRVVVDGSDIGGLRGRALRTAQKRTAMIFQQFNLLSTVRVIDNVAMPLLLDGMPRAEARRRATDAIEFVGLADRAAAFAGELSGGQKQRVGIARALVRQPGILLADEATSALDPTTTAQIIALLRSVNREYGTTIVVVTHEMDVIRDLADEVAVMAGGRIVEAGTALDVFLHPRTDIAREFVGTVIGQSVPDRVIGHLGTAGVWRLLLLDDQVVQPLVSDLVSRFGVAVNMLHADMTEIGSHTVGQLIVKVEGASEDVARAREYLIARSTTFEEVQR